MIVWIVLSSRVEAVCESRSKMNLMEFVVVMHVLKVSDERVH